MNRGPTAPESSTLTTRLPSHPDELLYRNKAEDIDLFVEERVERRGHVDDVPSSALLVVSQVHLQRSTSGQSRRTRRRIAAHGAHASFDDRLPAGCRYGQITLDGPDRTLSETRVFVRSGPCRGIWHCTGNPRHLTRGSLCQHEYYAHIGADFHKAMMATALRWRRHGVDWGGHVRPTFVRGRSLN